MNPAERVLRARLAAYTLHAKYDARETTAAARAAFLAGSLPRTAARLVREWAELRRSELQDNWDRAQAPTKLVPIEPLR